MLLKLSLHWNDFQDNIKSAFGNSIEDNDSYFADVTLACEDGYQVEAHKVILDGSRPHTTIHTHWSELEDFIFHPKYFSSGGKRRWWEDTSDLQIYVIFHKMRNRGQNLEYQEEKMILFKSWKSREEREIVPQNLENREEKEKLFYKILKLERRKRSSI